MFRNRGSGTLNFLRLAGSRRPNVLCRTGQPKIEITVFTRKIYKTLREKYKKFKKIAKVNLYVAGYTDSVGDASSNQTLSERRAKEIAKWFRSSGFKGNIFYQGFGEKGQAVPTADNVDEVRNRRSLYIVAAEKPATSQDLPYRQWKPLK